MKRDIYDRSDIRLVIEVFYDKLLNDEKMKPFFVDLQLQEHFEVLCDFWENALFQAGKYRGDMMDIHMEVNSRMPITQEHFTSWLEHFSSSVRALHTGENATIAINKARTIATIMKAKIDRLDQQRLELNN